MPASRNRLINAARRSMMQRAQLRRKLDVAQQAFKPQALVDRGKYRLSAAVDDTAHAVRKQFRDNRLPITLAAVAGLAWMFREPIRTYAPTVGRKARDLANALAERLRPADTAADESAQTMENDDEALR
ncbi:hypothetical protein [Sphingopyxis sp. MG]|jgi:hypothetical protein|uniref:hypothetical protein n=2 Tax=Sphingopyxis TaxID=165697 RepID=UPI0008364CD6|nr:hypothetical protein [Sphingopyxis sp. MG]APW72874.1 hypothetical protein BWD40_08525 [Sphingopyxis granuli]AVA13573.1 hypothetical protein C3E99_06705 [Sphingopyxis sp. MG]